ncbi:MAG: hypothetical protein ACI4ET_01690 [Bilifractor sp.]
MDMRNGHKNSKNRKTRKKNKCYWHIALCVMLAITIAVTANIGILPVMALSNTDMVTTAVQEPAGDTAKQAQSESGSDTVTTDGTVGNATSKSETNVIVDPTAAASDSTSTALDSTAAPSKATTAASDTTSTDSDSSAKGSDSISAADAT